MVYRQFLEMVRYGSKKKKETKKANEYLENFKKLIKKEQGGLETLLEEKAAERWVFLLFYGSLVCAMPLFVRVLFCHNFTNIMIVPSKKTPSSKPSKRLTPLPWAFLLFHKTKTQRRMMP